MRACGKIGEVFIMANISSYMIFTPSVHVHVLFFIGMQGLLFNQLIVQPEEVQQPLRLFLVTSETKLSGMGRSLCVI